MRTPLILLVDLAVVLVFAGIGRDSHGEGLAPTQILTVAWPFLVATGVGWALAYTLSQVRSTNPETHTFHPLRLFPDGTIIWVATVAVGMVARALLTTRGIAPSFVVVAAVFLGLFLLGWRAVATRLLARAARSDVAEERAGHL